MNNLKPQFPVTVTARHMPCTDSIRNYIETKLSRIPYQYPRIMNATAVVDHESHGESVKLMLNCANHVVLDANTETQDLYEAIDLTIEKIGRRMRKEKTKYLQKKSIKLR